MKPLPASGIGARRAEFGAFAPKWAHAHNRTEFGGD
jgi:hypothetical protein